VAALIEDQIHQHFKDEEEKRCLALEAQYQLDPKKKGKRVERRSIPKPWTRFGDGLCQAIELLSLVNEFDYDLEDEGFQAYCEERGVLHVAGEAGSRRWKCFSRHNWTKEKYLADPFFQSAESVGGSSHEYTPEEMETGWKIIMLGRAKLQDCWELYSRG
jgi:hypothetical protein